MTTSRPPALLAPEPGPGSLKHRPWGGARLGPLRDPSGAIPRPIGESWEFSTVPGSESRADGQPLTHRLGRALPLLAKLLDTAVPLSVQLHPDDDPAAGRLGKEEAWVVLDADPGATVLAGLRDGVDGPTFEAALREALADPMRGDRLIDRIEAIPVRRGTVVLVPAGTVHAVGGGILIAEIQQPTDATLRLFDYGSERELHVDAGLAALRPASRPRVRQPGDDVSRLQGKHIELEVLGPGRWTRRATSDELLVACGDGGVAETDAGPHPLAHGALRLAVAGLGYTVDVAPGSSVVVGTCDAAR